MRCLLSLAGCFALFGCDSEGIVRPPQVKISIVDTAGSYSSVTVVRERASMANLQYGGGASLSIDSGEYDFSVIYTPGGTTETIEAVGGEDQAVTRFRQVTDAAVDAEVASLRNAARFAPIADVVLGLVSGVVILFGVQRVVDGSLTIGSLLVVQQG